MAGGAELEELSHELESGGGAVAERGAHDGGGGASELGIGGERRGPGVTVTPAGWLWAAARTPGGSGSPTTRGRPPWQRFLDELAGVGLRVAGAGPVRVPADGPGPARRRAGPARADGRRRHDARRERAAPRRRLAGDRGQDPQGRRADRRGRRPAPGLRAGARLPRRHHRGLPGAGRARPTTSGRRWCARPTSSAGSWPRSTGVRAAVPPARRQPRGDPGADRAVPGRHRPAVRQPLPGHRAPGVPAGGQRRS